MIKFEWIDGSIQPRYRWKALCEANHLKLFVEYHSVVFSFTKII